MYRSDIVLLPLTGSSVRCNLKGSEVVACLRRLTILKGFEPVTSQSPVWPDTANSIDAEFSFSLAGQGVTSSGKREHIAKVARKNLPFDSSTRIKPANAFRKRGQPMLEF
ncbi:hypothetical protein JOQ06_025710 [Pogonophryne albipinna]|uniref:Uncharacterized protein n=1 Tax=Pogonophryne albipinna TaxID=1090488 RepID=A0AAD6AW98_9TELE|nr:hypothetical protein JOQ06_025710 [Pogonophryne albipinna]